MGLNFYKIEATGNDFIVIDNRDLGMQVSDRDRWARYCGRRTGIGADGVLLLNNSETTDFSMRYINADGGEASMCGNGARALAWFYSLLTGKTELKFETAKGVHEAQIDEFHVNLTMSAPTSINKYILDEFGYSKSLFVDTGVPHAVFYESNLDNLNILKVAPPIRFSSLFPTGSNVNFYKEVKCGTIQVRTYERGVEDETLSCGTGVVAASLCYMKHFNHKGPVKVQTKGGELSVHFDLNGKAHLCGAVTPVCRGEILL